LVVRKKRKCQGHGGFEVVLETVNAVKVERFILIFFFVFFANIFDLIALTVFRIARNFGLVFPNSTSSPDGSTFPHGCQLRRVCCDYGQQ